MDVAPSLVMKAIWTTLVVLCAVGLAYVLAGRLQPSMEAPAEDMAVVLQPMEVSPPMPEPMVEVEAPCLVEVPETIEEPKKPVQPIEERGDAMLFESEALFGTPFDRAVVIPFN